MAVGLPRPQNVRSVGGVQLAAVAAGIKSRGGPDLVVIRFEPGTVCAGVFTRNAFRAAPVIVAEQHLSQANPRALLINAGNANAGTGDRGLADARRCCMLLGRALDCAAAEVLPFSTGVIGEYLPVDRIASALEQVPAQLGTDAWIEAAEAIMTTDTIAKACSRTLDIDGVAVTVTGIAKGAGMIRPDMATMLAFIATDAVVGREWLQRCLTSAVDASFNCITVDGDTSTNDACVLAATGASGCKTLEGGCDASDRFKQALNEVAVQLAQAIVRDGEGATKFVTVHVGSAASVEEARQVAYAVAQSPLVKTALFASDPNWGRILAAVGRAGLDDLDIDRVSIYLEDVPIVSAGGRDPDYREPMGQQVMNQPEIAVRIVLNRGEQQATVWTTDLSYDYVKINAEYRT